jgi:hypothetical protein
VVFASNFSSEGSDLQTLELPGDQDQLIKAVADLSSSAGWVAATSVYHVSIGSNERDLPLTAAYNYTPEHR